MNTANKDGRSEFISISIVFRRGKHTSFQCFHVRHWTDTLSHVSFPSYKLIAGLRNKFQIAQDNSTLSRTNVKQAAATEASVAAAAAVAHSGLLFTCMNSGRSSCHYCLRKIDE
jgi:hypothetical protein